MQVISKIILIIQTLLQLVLKIFDKLIQTLLLPQFLSDFFLSRKTIKTLPSLKAFKNINTELYNKKMHFKGRQLENKKLSLIMERFFGNPIFFQAQLQFLIMQNRAATKTVQNYYLQQLKYHNPDESELWDARHKILKKNFTVKRMPLKSQENHQHFLRDQANNRDQWNQQNLMREVNLLKRQNTQSMPRCHKLIKTTNSIYLVYDQFPGVSLSQYLMQNNPKKCEKIQLLLEISKGLEEWHSKDIVFINLTVNNIHVYNEKSIFYRDWSLARSLTQSKVEEGYKWINNQEDIAPEVCGKGQISCASDIYCLGRVFRKIMHSGMLENPTNEELKIQDMIASMIKQKPKERPSLTQIIRLLKGLKVGNWSSANRISTPKHKNDSVSRTSTRHNTQQDEKVYDNDIFILENQFNFSQRYFAKKDVDLQIPQLAFKSLSAKNSNNQLRNDHVERRLSYKNAEGIKDFSFNQVRNSKRLNSSIGDIEIDSIKKICKKRSLVFFILQLSQFVVKSQLCTILGYLFTKYARLSFQNLLRDSQKMLCKTQKGKQLLSILHDEQVRISISQTMIKQALCSEQTQQIGFKRELIDENTIGDRYLNAKIIEFARLVVIECEDKLSQNYKDDQSINFVLYKTFLILQKIEEGSYEKYWEKERGREILDKNPIKQEIHSSQRYLKSKIAQILKKK